MPTTLARELSITYGSYVVGGAQTTRILEAWYWAEESHDLGVVEFTFLLRATTEALFDTACSDAEDIFRTPWQDLTITLGSATLKAYSHAGGTGFNGRPTITKVADKASTGRSRRYKVRIEFDLPADKNSRAGRRRNSVDCQYSEARKKTVTIAGTWTTIGSTGARDQYEAQIAAYATAVLNAIGGTYKILNEPTTAQDEDDKLIDFSRTYEEIIMTGVGAGDASVRDERLTIARDEESSGDSPLGGRPVDKLVTLTAQYHAAIDRDSSTDLEGKWSSLRSAVISKMRGILDGGSMAIVKETPSYEPTANTIDVTLVGVGTTGNGIIEYKETITTTVQPGKQGVGWWTGSPYSKHVFQGPGSYRRKVQQTYVTMGPIPEFPTDKLAPPGGWKSYDLSGDTTETPVMRGMSGGSLLSMNEITRIAEVEWYTEAAGGGAGEVSTSGATTEAGRAAFEAWRAAHPEGGGNQFNPPR